MDTPDLNDISAWQYTLPEQLIASRPATRRDGSRLMVVSRSTGKIEHRSIRDLPDLLHPGDRLVFNNTKVLPGRLFGIRTETTGKWEGLFLNEESEGKWRITGQTRGRLKQGETLTITPAASQIAPKEAITNLTLRLEERGDDGTWIVSTDRTESAFELLQEFGTLPLPPYIGRKVADKDDEQRYQTVFANAPGAIAAPTAGLHFTRELLKRCNEGGVSQSEVTLHVGIGTFRPVSSEKLSDHTMHSEWCRLDAQAACEVKQTKESGGHIVAIGTTSVRTLEAAARANPQGGWAGSTDLFIRPGFEFRTVDNLLTNFHLPGSTLIVLVAALAGYELIMEAYRKAVEERYRFYSYGDAMLIR